MMATRTRRRRKARKVCGSSWPPQAEQLHLNVPTIGLVMIPLFLLLAMALPPGSFQQTSPLQQQQQQQLPPPPIAQVPAYVLPPPVAYVAPPLSVIEDQQRLALQQQQQQADALAALTLPVQAARPNVRVNVRDWSRRVSEDIRLVSERTSCVRKIGQFFEDEGKFYQLDPLRLRESILNQTNALLGQHKAAVNGIVMEAEKAALAHHFIKNLTVNYTDVHRVRNKNDQTATSSSSVAGGGAYFFNNNNLQEYPNDYTTNTYGPSSSTGDKPTFTSISGGTPVPGPVEWQTPVRDIEMFVNPNFGDIPVNTSMSAVHLPLPIYPGLPEIMNGIAWTERLDWIFRRNLAQFMHVHHQYYGDTLGFMRTFPAHKWRIPRNEPDLFDARTRPWYIAGAATPKDVVILVDTSGSMTGLRREIAKGVVFEILDTLTINDHFAVLRFSETVTPVGLPKCTLKTPRFSVQLRDQCRAAGGGPLPSGSEKVTSRVAEQQAECSNWRRQWDTRQQYLRDYPSVAANKNASYLFDEAYDQSIVNVTLDIRDAYLLPATSRNVRYLKSNFSMPTAGIANFTRALMAGFELLQAYNRTNDLGSQCNQAIMLITDGAIKSHEDVFNRYNYPGAPIRVFSYMIGREVGDVRPTKEMACRNRGYYTHVINLSEVREQVQKYLPVMARPLVLAHHHPITWTNAYGDETHQVLTDWVLEIKRRERARIMLAEEREHLMDANSSDVINTEQTSIQEYDELQAVDELLKNRIICEDAKDDLEAMEQSLKEEIDPLGYNDLACHWAQRRADLLTSVVKPVFDQRNSSIFFERVLSKNVWQEREIHLTNAQLLGVASVDLRVADIIRAAPSHLLGPNGYSILLGQNAFIMHHPNFYALLEDPFDKQSKLLKPYFNSVDLTHVEQVYHKNESDSARRRADETKLLKLREAAVNRSNGMESINVKRTVDCRRRPHIRAQTFYYGPIKDTPYAFMLALPDSYGLNRVSAKLTLDRDSFSYLRPSTYDLWTVHPEYRYCERVSSSQSSNGGNQLHLNDSLSTLIELLNATATGEPYELDYDDLSTISGSSNTQEQLKSSYRQKFLNSIQQQQQQQQTARYICDKELFGSLLFDAKATYESFVSTSSGHNNDDGSCAQTSEQMSPLYIYLSLIPRTKLAQIYGLEMSFVATRSGLTRTLVFDDTPRIKKLAKLFIERHDRAVDESWYSRTVDWNMRFNEEATIITAPYNAYVRLIAKLRQRITQRHPAYNDTRSNCDPSLMEDARIADEAQEAAAASAASPAGTTSMDTAETAPPVATIESSSGIVQIANSQPTSDVQNDEPHSSTGSEQASQQDEQQDQQASSDSPTVINVSGSGSGSGGGAGDEATLPEVAKINYHNYSSFDFLDLLANSSVHISATQSVIVNKSKRQNRTPVAVTGHLYDYAIFARKFLNSTSLSIKTYSDPPAPPADFVAGQVPPPLKVDICPGGECPVKCGLRNDTIDCLLVDNNGYIVVGEELPYVGRSLIDYDERLMQSLVAKKVFHQIIITDYQAICQDTRGANGSGLGTNAAWAQSATGSGQVASSLGPASQTASVAAAQTSASVSLSHPFKWELAQTVLANCAQVIVWTAATIYSAFFLHSARVLDPNELFASESLLGRLHQWQRSAIMLTVDAQSATANQSLLALLPNKTFLKPCERPQVLYESRPYESAKLYDDSPEYYVSKCGCSGWYVYDVVPKTNLILLIVNTTAACRRCDTPTTVATTLDQQQQQQQQQQQKAEDQVCTMLERDVQLYVQKPSSCLAQHADESSIHICGSATRPQLSYHLLSMLTSFVVLVILYDHNRRI